MKTITEGQQRLAYTRAEAIAVTGLSSKTIDFAIAQGHLPVIRRNARKFIILAEDLQAWLRRCRETGIPSPTQSQADREKLADFNRKRIEEAAKRKATATS